MPSSYKRLSTGEYNIGAAWKRETSRETIAAVISGLPRAIIVEADL